MKWASGEEYRILERIRMGSSPDPCIVFEIPIKLWPDKKRVPKTEKA